MTCGLTMTMLRRLQACILAAFCFGCTPQQMLLNALVPDGTASMLLSHLQEVKDDNRQRIIELEQKGDWAGMAKFADANIAGDPFSAEWHMIGGYAQTQLRDYPRAITYFNDMVRLAPDDATGYHFLAEAQRVSGQPQRAVATLERALLVVRESPLTYQLLGDAYSDMFSPRQAVVAYRRALAIDAQMENAWFGLGRASLQLGRDADAQEALTVLQQMQSPRTVELRALMARR